ncbi:MAG: efflux RND transporter permease subunit, partial [Bacteroidales bacterium]|nr:efflux RND transporter permease subunit [Bacteroidales bacterium]
RYRRWIIGAAILVVALCIWPLTRTSINPDLESYLPASMQSKQNNRLIEEIFGAEEPILIVMESEDVLNRSSLERIEQLDRAFSMQPVFKRVFSLFSVKEIRSEEGMMVVDPLIGSLPKSTDELELLRERIKGSDLAYELVVSADFRYSLIMLSSDKSLDDVELLQIINQTLEKYPGDEKLRITGQPVLRDEASNKIGRDIMILLPLGLLVMFVFLWLSFREARGVFLPISVVIFSIVVSMALIPLFGWELSIIGVLIPIMMLAIANNYGVYFIARYQDLNAHNQNLSMPQIVRKSFSYLFKPVLFCGLTTIVGILGLTTHLMIPARQMGVVTGLGIAFALAASLLFVPAVLSLMKKGKPHQDLSGKPNGPISAFLYRTAAVVIRRPKRVILGFTVFFAVVVTGLLFFKLSPDTNNILPEKHSFNKAIAVADKNFGGSKTISLMFEADAKEPALLRELERYESELKSLPQVGSVTSLTTIIKQISMALNDPDEPGYNQIPQSREAVAQYLELYGLSGDPEDLEQFVDFDFEHTLLTVQYRAASIEEIEAVTDKINELNKSSEFAPLTGGYSLVEKELNESIMKGQNNSLFFALLAIILLMSLIFKSPVAGLIGSIPLAFAVLSIFGLMGWMGMELTIVTALLSSISIGLGVDFTIQVFWRIQWELNRGKHYPAAIRMTLKTIGRGIVINAFAVMLGFAVLFFSAFPLVRSFGLLIILSLLLCLISALILIPAICMLWKPKFLSKKTQHKSSPIAQKPDKAQRAVIPFVQLNTPNIK